MGYSFVYERILENITNEDAFKLCVKRIFPLLNYKVLQEEDVRRIDLAEKLYEMEKYVDKDIKEKAQGGTIDYYAYMLSAYLECYIEAKAGSREEKYIIRAKELIAGISRSESAIVDVKDAFMIFISLFRTLKNYLDRPEKYYVLGAVFEFRIDDEKLLDEIWKRNNLTPIKLTEKATLFNGGDNGQMKKTYFYIISVLLLAYGLQEQGVFTKEVFYE